MTDEERKELYCKMCDEAHSNIEAPIMGAFYDVECNSCANQQPVSEGCITMNCPYYTWEELQKYWHRNSPHCPHYEKK